MRSPVGREVVEAMGLGNCLVDGGATLSVECLPRRPPRLCLMVLNFVLNHSLDLVWTQYCCLCYCLICANTMNDSFRLCCKDTGVAQGPPPVLGFKKESRTPVSLTNLFEVVAEDLLILNQNLQSVSTPEIS
jgi:hypothetical protein